MAADSEDHARSAEELSSLVDGELDAAGVLRACARWREDAESRATWHAYQLIGDVLRSEDLATDSGRDAAFLGSLRARLATEPVVLAPTPADATDSSVSTLPRPDRSAVRRQWAWITSSAVAAGFAAVAAVVVVTREPVLSPMAAHGTNVADDAGRARPVATASRIETPPPPRSAPGQGSAPALVASERRPLQADVQLIRDAGLDRYLSAHKHFAGSAALGVPSQFLRSATVDSSGR